MKKIILIILTLSALSLSAQETANLSPEQFGLEDLTGYLGLKPDDIGFRPDYTEPDSFRLEIISKLMRQPLGMIEYTNQLKQSHVKKQPELLARYLFTDLKKYNQTGRSRAYKPTLAELNRPYTLYYHNMTLNQLLTKASLYLDIILPKSTSATLARLSKDEQKFLTDQFKELIVIHKEHETLPIETLDSLDNIEEGYIEDFVTFGYKVDKDPIISAGIDCLREMMLEIKNLQREMQAGGTKDILKKNDLPGATNLAAYLGQQEGWKIGGPGNDYYNGEYKFILDLGGDDVYDLTYDPSNPHGVIIIDLSGNDVYRGETDFTLGSGCLSAGLLLDFGGNDNYIGRSFGVGSGYFGFGLLYDAEGDDRYDGDTHVQGAGTFGLGLVIDEGGRDIYNSAVHSQGFGFVEGAGIIYDGDGSDSYYAGGKYKDVLRYDDHFLSLSQGFGYGLRPYMSGGIGAIVDVAGNDSYYGDIFAQGSSYWWSLGILYDLDGIDKYDCFQYGQGCGTHMTIGILVDDKGNDTYFGKGLMHGVGHDYSCGIILDRAGDDTYTAYDLSQGAGSANGAGVLIDLSGDDRYSVKNNANTQGYGNPRRDFGSIGLFIDLGGNDQYQGNGKNNYYWRTNSKWGGGMDIELNPPDSSEVTNEK